MAAMMMTMMSFAKTQDWGGRVIDEKGEPMPYVNVVLLSLPDSAFVQGAMTDEHGVFKIATNVNNGVLKVSSVGYQTLYINAGEGLTIQMKEDTQILGEVVVKSQLPKTHAKGDAMRTTVAGTILEKAGTVSDALSKIPSLEAERDGAVKVLGRGDAEVYINGRRVQDVKELSRLRSDQIQHVDVVQNPGARYAAATKAVVRITLKKAQGEGISFQDNLSGIYQYDHTLTNNLDVNYRTGGLAGRYGHTKSLQENTLTYYAGPDKIEGVSTQESKNIWKGWSPQLQVNYMLDENHSFGAFYKYDRHPSGDFNSMFYTDSYENSIFKERSESHIIQEDMFTKHIFNAYYNGKVGRLSIDLNIDGLFDDTQSPGNTTEKTLPQPLSVMEGQGGGSVGEVSFRSIESNTVSSNNFWASKLIFGYPVWKGNLSLGGEYTYNHRTDAYDFKATDAVPVKTTDTEINEKSAAVFAEYGRQFGKVFAQVGLRYEHLRSPCWQGTALAVIPSRYRASTIRQPDQFDGLYQSLYLPERQPVSEAYLHTQRCTEYCLQVDEPDAELRAHKGRYHNVDRALPRFHRPVHQPRASHQQSGGLRPPDRHRLRTSHHRLLASHLGCRSHVPKLQVTYCHWRGNHTLSALVQRFLAKRHRTASRLTLECRHRVGNEG